jgi:hypothetical protein
MPCANTISRRMRSRKHCRRVRARRTGQGGPLGMKLGLAYCSGLSVASPSPASRAMHSNRGSEPSSVTTCNPQWPSATQP